jgi:PEP-CTERM motif
MTHITRRGPISDELAFQDASEFLGEGSSRIFNKCKGAGVKIMSPRRKCRLHFLAVVLLLVFSNCEALADAIPGLFDTGVDNNGDLLPGGATDPHYALVSSPNSASAVVADSNVYPLGSGGRWLADGPNSQWISPSSDGATEPVGNYFYQTTFDLTGYDPATAEITGQWTVDDSGLDIFLNGASTGISYTIYNADATFSPPFTISNGFVSGINTLEFEVYNAEGPTGFRAEVSGTVNVPEPTTLAILFSGLLLWRRRPGLQSIRPPLPLLSLYFSLAAANGRRWRPDRRVDCGPPADIVFAL